MRWEWLLATASQIDDDPHARFGSEVLSLHADALELAASLAATKDRSCERLQATIRGEAVDRPAWSLWRHFYETEATAETRIDRWLCAVRLVKTRSMATQLCDAGHVRVNGNSAKASTKVRAGDRVEGI